LRGGGSGGEGGDQDQRNVAPAEEVAICSLHLSSLPASTRTLKAPLA
jgi:hypothetical protein